MSTITSVRSHKAHLIFKDGVQIGTAHKLKFIKGFAMTLEGVFWRCNKPNTSYGANHIVRTKLADLLQLAALEPEVVEFEIQPTVPKGPKVVATKLTCGDYHLSQGQLVVGKAWKNTKTKGFTMSLDGIYWAFGKPSRIAGDTCVQRPLLRDLVALADQVLAMDLQKNPELPKFNPKAEIPEKKKAKYFYHVAYEVHYGALCGKITKGDLTLTCDARLDSDSFKIVREEIAKCVDPVFERIYLNSVTLL